MRSEKTILTQQIKDTLTSSEYFFAISYSHINSKQQKEFKSLLREHNSILNIQKNSTILHALKDTDFSDISQFTLTNSTALVYGQGEPVEPAKVIKKISKQFDSVEIKFSFVDGEVLDAEKSKLIANLPTKEQAQAQLLGMLNSIPQSLVRLLNAVPSGVVNVLNARKNSIR